MTNQFDYYAILGVDETASTAEIREAFDTMRLSFPEDQRDPDANPEYERILHAYQVLVDTSRRDTYDTLLAETAPLSLKIDIQASRNQVSKSDDIQRVYILLKMHAPEKKQEKQRPLNLCLVVDRSTSMQGERLRCVKTAVDLLVEKLSTEDLLSVISFSDRAELVVPPQSAAEKSKITNKVRGISASGGTEIYQGLHAGVDALKQQPLQSYTNHLILLTDGHTYGDAEQCLLLANRAANLGIGISAFGLGNEWNDQFLDQLVAPSGGQSDFIESPSQIIDFLRQRIKGLGQLYARNMRLQNEFPNAVQVEQGFKLLPFAQPLALDGDVIQLGDVESRYPLSILLQIAVTPQPVETRITVPFLFAADIPAQRMRERSFKRQHQLLVVTNPPQQQPPPAIMEAVRMLNLHQMGEKVQKEVEAGETELAKTRMRYLSTRLLQAGKTKLAQQAHMEAERLAQMGEISAEGRKKIKYGTRTLLNQTVKLKSE